MAKYVIQTDKGAPPLGAYSQGWRAGDFIFVTGTGPIGLDGKVKGATIQEQTDRPSTTSRRSCEQTAPRWTTS